jgi:hypothetical protein
MKNKVTHCGAIAGRRALSEKVRRKREEVQKK